MTVMSSVMTVMSVLDLDPLKIKLFFDDFITGQDGVIGLQNV